MSKSDDPNQVASESDYEIGQDNITTNIGPFGLDIHNPVFLIAGLGIFCICHRHFDCTGTGNRPVQGDA